MNRSPR